MARAPLSGFLLVLAGAVGIGFMPYFARLAYGEGMTAEAVALWRYLIAAAAGLPFVWRARRHAAKHAKRQLALGVMLGAATMFYFVGLAHLSVAQTILILFTYPMFTILLERYWRAKPWRWPTATAAVLVFIAAALLLGTEPIAPAQVRYAALTFLTPIGIAAYIVAQASGGTEGGSGFARVGWVFMGAVLGTLLVAALSGADLALPESGRAWLGVGAVALLGSIGGVGLLTLGAALTGAGRAGVAGVGELLTALAVGWLLLGEAVTAGAVVSAAIMIAALLLALPWRAQAR